MTENDGEKENDSRYRAYISKDDKLYQNEIHREVSRQNVMTFTYFIMCINDLVKDLFLKCIDD